MKLQRSPGLPRGFRLDPEYNSTPVLLRPLGLLSGAIATQAIATGRARALAGGPLAFTQIEIFLASDGGEEVEMVMASISEVEEWAVSEGESVTAAVAAQIQALSVPRGSFAGLDMNQPRIMGVINVTPDSFYDGGRLSTSDAAVDHGHALIAAGADILDIGGESTRPGSDAVTEAAELDRILPVIDRLAGTGAVISVDTRRPAVMREACAAGATIINDICALTEPGALEAAAETGAAVMLMHMQGAPASMQEAPSYDHAPYETAQFLSRRIKTCEAAGMETSMIAVDPGIGFGKTLAHNLEILEALPLYHALGCALALGVSRKSFIGAITGIDDSDDRLPGTLAAVGHGAAQGVQIHRVHDVAEAQQAVAVMRAIAESGGK
ncbi:MAG: dihydropteroate synthase [Rhodospirillaceae bacterium]|jgi:dihydropteroate synthase|nr:dihydropteroate synthase [Rhodospirillaceae bacterium]MBT5457276.1 dihydropteroate synthase [Rhodospirillaceae bacterium]